MFRSRGLRLSLVGALIYFLSLFSLVALPSGPPIVGMALGGAAICAGFVWTLLSPYSS